MPIREMSHPQWTVAREEGLVKIRFVVPYSKFGVIKVSLDPEEAAHLCAQLGAELGGC